MSILREKMIELEKKAIEYYKIPSLILMEDAALGIFNKINKYNSYTVVCGSGNNGGDGIAIARHLLLNNKDVEIYLIGEEKSEDLKTNLEIIRRFNIEINYIKSKDDIENLVNSLEVNEVCVDAIFGTGLTRAVNGIYADVIGAINLHSNYTISIDIPSGLDCNTGIVLDYCVNADETMAIYEIKEGMLKNEICGKISTIYLGIPRA